MSDIFETTITPPEVFESTIIAQQGPSGTSAIARPPNPVFTYTGAQLTRVDYSNGWYRLFFYSGTLLDHIDFYAGSDHLRKTFVYSSGRLASVTETTF